RADLVTMPVNAIHEWKNIQRRSAIWEADGRESSVALTEANGLAFSINGKCDGNSIEDAPTQIMLGMVSALHHPSPKSAFVVGLGTGCSAGWLGAITDMERVVVAELEPMVLEVASRCAPINHAVLANPKVQVRLGDARELLLIDNQTYDLIVSEPSNPFRAGISSLFTREFYEAVNRRLAQGGLFSQWVQGYEIDVQTMKTVYATLRTVFPYVETWQTSYGDYLLICSRERLAYSRTLLEQRLKQEPWKGALWQGWRVNSVEGIFSHYVANADFVNMVHNTTNPRDHLSTDDRVTVEFGLLRTMGRKNLGMMQALQVEANSNQLQKPLMRDGTIDWAEVRDQNLLALTLSNQECKTLDDPDRGFLLRVAAHTNYRRENFRGFVQNWSGQDRKPLHPGESLMLAESFARFGAPETTAMVEPAQAEFPGESQLILATYFSEIGSYSEAVACFEKGFGIFRQRPFPVEPIIRRGMEMAMNLALKHPELAPRLAESLRQPFLLSAVNELRVQAIVGLLPKLEPVLVREYCHALEPNVPWQDEFLITRRDCYKATNDPLWQQAAADVDAYLAGEPNRGGTDAFLK
ncbi:MAG TPA: fused MFS/spermidine synthase, partial [Candidatus Ozemobacteraceae bacterium]|nr:fused MFS/spermidine synthase [Candidatus Ozemobacteraceae bacterium]